MIVKNLVLVNPFIEAFSHSDLLGKLIFISLILLSVITWVIVVYKSWITNKIRKNSYKFNEVFQSKKINPLSIEIPDPFSINPFLELYQVLKKNTVEILNKNRLFGLAQTEQKDQEPAAFLSSTDIEIVQSHLSAAISSQTKRMEASLFILSTIVTLGPFLGLLGTVWGILTTFSELQSSMGANTNQMVLSGLSLALATTVLGLIDAIPALIGYNYLKNAIRNFETEMEGFSTEILSSVEMQYRKVNVH